MNSKLQIGAQTAIKQCIQLEPSERIVIITDEETKEVGDALKAEAAQITSDILYLTIEDYAARPVKEFNQRMWAEIVAFKPNVSIYAAQGKQGELQVFRGPLKDRLIQELGCRHAHMISITKELMEDGLNKDYAQVYKVTHKVYDIVNGAEKIKVTDPHGTAITYELDQKIKWVRDSGNLHEHYGNLPAGEVYTAPKNVNGIFVGWILGDYMSEKYGILDEPITLIIENGYVSEVNAPEPIKSEFEEYISEYENGNRVGELGIGTLIGLDDFVGNLLQDEKFPGVHMAMGSPYPESTGADWECPSHIDTIARNTTITVVKNNEETLIMKNGEYSEEILVN